MTLKTNFCPDCGKRNSDIHTCSPAYAVEKAKKAEKQEPVAWISPGGHIHFDPHLNSIPLYTTPPAAQRQPLTDDEIDNLELPPSGKATVRDLVRIIEAAHGIKEKT